MTLLLSLHELSVSIADKQVLDHINLLIGHGQLHVIMGPNGSGKSSLAFTIMGHPSYIITNGTIECEDTVINQLPPHKRAKCGIFLSMQHPVEIEGLPLKDFIRQAYNALYDGTPKQLRLKEFVQHLEQQCALLNIDKKFIERSLNVGFSGGEKKRAEMLQLAVLQPKIAILDEIDSGLDIDALKIVCQTLNAVRAVNPSMSILLITHYKRILEYLKPDAIHVLVKGKITRSGGLEIADELEQEGYQKT